MWSYCACLRAVFSVGHLSHEFDNIQKDLFPSLRLESTSIMLIWQCRIAIKVSNLLNLFKFWILNSLSLSCEPEANSSRTDIHLSVLLTLTYDLSKEISFKKKNASDLPSQSNTERSEDRLANFGFPWTPFPAPALYIIVSVPTLQWALSLPSNKWACNHSIASESCLDKPPPTLPATYCDCQLTLTQMRSTNPDLRNFLSHENRGIEKWFSKLKGKKASELGDRYQNWVF